MRGRVFPRPLCGLLRRGVRRAPAEWGAGRELFYAVQEEDAGPLGESLPIPAGRSAVCHGLEQLNACYRQACGAWQRSFFSGALCAAPLETPGRPLAVNAQQLAGLAGLSRGTEAVRLLRGEAQGVACGEKSPDAFARLCAEFAQQMNTSYQSLTKRYGADFENKQKIRQGVQYIQQHFREPLNMAVVSNHVSMNYSLFSLLFKQYTGGNFVSYLQKLRIDEAKRLLETTDRRVNEIGRSVGFSDEKHFLKVFKSAVGMSPTEYRKSALLLQREQEEGK